MHLVDTHQHFWDQDRYSYSWTKGVPPLDRSFLLEDYLTAAADSGITKTIFMECDVDRPHALDEAKWVQELADRHPLIAGIVAGGYPADPDFADHLEALAAIPKVRGLRQVLHTLDDDFSRQPAFREGLRRLPAAGLTFDLCVLSRQLPRAIELVEACPETTFILDHCGVPDIKGGGFSPWDEHIARLATFPNVAACKISGIVAYAEPFKWTVDDLRPWFDQVLAQFGWDRLVWGGDWPVCTLSAELSGWVEATRALVADASDEQRAKLFHLNAERIYRV